MPTYEYKCEECGIVFDRFQHFSEDPLKTCPECEGPVHRIIHPVGIIFKGKGFYVTDNRGGKSAVAPASSGKEDGHKAATESSTSPSSPSPTSSASSSDTNTSKKDD